MTNPTRARMKGAVASPTLLSPETATAADRAYLSIRASVLAGRYSSGMHLKEDELASEIGVSRTPVRQAIMRLVAEGMLQHTPNHGVTVKVWSRSEITEIFHLRAVLEGHGAELAALRINDDEIDQLRYLDGQMAAIMAEDRIGQLNLLSEMNGQFHRTIYRAARSERLAQMLGNLIEIPLVLHTFRRYNEDQLQRSISHHRELVQALVAREPLWAGTVMRAHIFAAKNVFSDT